MYLSFSAIEFGSPSFDECIALRDLVLRKPLNLSFTIDQISLEYKSIHLGAYDFYGILVGCLVLQKHEEGYKMRQVAVHPKHQNKGIGGKLVSYSETISKDLKVDKIVLHARDTAIPFYLKHSYKKKGRAFLEVGIKHYKMYKILK